MIKNTHFLTSFIIATSLFLMGAQVVITPTELSSVLENYKKAVLGEDAKTQVSLTYPELFKLAPKLDIVQNMEQMYENQAMPKIKKMTFTSFEQAAPYSKGELAVVGYKLRMELPRPGDATPQIDQMMREMLLKNLGAHQTKLNIDEKNHLVVIHRQSRIFAFREGKTDWTLMDQDQFKAAMGKKILPADLEKKLMACVSGAC